ncbi:MAG: RNA degradosome polyphosphate kinase [Geminicoccaceae bacterium]
MTSETEPAVSTQALAEAPAMSTPTQPAVTMDTPERFINRELSWLGFNERVLEEADNKNHPLLERLRFISISGSNLDEFMMVRYAGLKAQERAEIEDLTPEGLTPTQQIERTAAKVHDLSLRQDEAWDRIKTELAEVGIRSINGSDLRSDEATWLDREFENDIFPVLTPIAADPPNPFPFIPNLGFTVLLNLTRERDGKRLHGLIQIPKQLGRFIRLPGSSDDIRFIAIEKVISHYLNRLFPGFEIGEVGYFRVIRDSDLEIEEEAEDLVRSFLSALQQRRRGRVIRLVVNHEMSEHNLSYLKQNLGIGDSDVYRHDGPMALGDLGKLIVKDRPDLLFTPYTARFPERIAEHGNDCFAAIRAKDIVVHHPYETFDVVVNFLDQAAQDPDVVSIKQTLYRTSNDSPIVAALCRAAEAGKSVTALVELKARFDEEANIRWARDLEKAGVQVVYGFIELKTHAKLCMVVRREGEDMRTYMQFGTGNYHPITAKIYTDLSYFTCDPALGADAAKAFNYMTGYIEPVGMKKLAIAPMYLRETVYRHIDGEIANAKAGKPAAIWAKMNSLVDAPMIDKLYEASQAGVQIDLIIRGICCLRPGIPGLSETIRVKSIVGRFLEHPRIVCFANGAELPSRQAKVFISSADWMGRNLNRRVESFVPIENETVHAQILDQVMVANLKDNMQSWTSDSDGVYTRVQPQGEEPFSAHEYFMTNPSLSGRGSALSGENAPILELNRS